MEYLAGFIGGIVLFLFVLLLSRILLNRMVVFEFEKGLKFSRGKYIETLQPGTYWYSPILTRIDIVDTRIRYAAVTGQEILSADGIGLKISAAIAYRIADSYLANVNTFNLHEAVYTEIQIALREIVGSISIDELLQNRQQLAARLTERTAPKLQTLGVELTTANVKDIMFPGQLKQMFAQVEQAKKEGQASLERARGETAALRSLANAAKMLEKSPSLMQLRLLQSIGDSKGNTFIIGMPSQMTPIPVRGGEIEGPEAAEGNGEPDM